MKKIFTKIKAFFVKLWNKIKNNNDLMATIILIVGFAVSVLIGSRIHPLAWSIVVLTTVLLAFEIAGFTKLKKYIVPEFCIFGGVLVLYLMMGSWIGFFVLAGVTTGLFFLLRWIHSKYFTTTTTTTTTTETTPETSTTTEETNAKTE